MTLIVICGGNFRTFCPIDIFSLEIDSLNNEDNFVGQFNGLGTFKAEKNWAENFPFLKKLIFEG